MTPRVGGGLGGPGEGHDLLQLAGEVGVDVGQLGLRVVDLLVGGAVADQLQDRSGLRHVRDGARHGGQEGGVRQLGHLPYDGGGRGRGRVGLFDIELGMGMGGGGGGGSGAEGREAGHDVGEDGEGSWVGIHGEKTKWECEVQRFAKRDVCV